MPSGANDARNYDANDLLASINDTREFVEREIAYAERGDDDAIRFARLRSACKTIIKALTPKARGDEEGGSR